MDRATAERWTIISALTVAAIYAYRRLVEPASPGSLKNVVGSGNPVPLGQFATAWGVTFFVISLLATASPGLGGSFAILVMTGDLLANTGPVTKDINGHLTGLAKTTQTAQAAVNGLSTTASKAGAAANNAQAAGKVNP